MKRWRYKIETPLQAGIAFLLLMALVITVMLIIDQMKGNTMIHISSAIIIGFLFIVASLLALIENYRKLKLQRGRNDHNTTGTNTDSP